MSKAKVLEIRRTGRLPHEVVEDVLSALDVEEWMLDYSQRRARAAARLSGTLLALEGRRVRAPAGRRSPPVRTPDTPGECGDCVRQGTAWVHLRLCLSCGDVACCDSSPERHANAHFEQTGHPVMRSAEPGENWRWCFVDRLTG